jgi:hypothetical protein
MFSKMFESVSGVDLSSLDERIIDLLQRTWNLLSEDYCIDLLSKRSPGNIDRNSLARLEVPADDVRSTVFCNIRVWESISPSLYNKWFDLPIEKQDELLQKAFPSNQIYGV